MRRTDDFLLLTEKIINAIGMGLRNPSISVKQEMAEALVEILDDVRRCTIFEIQDGGDCEPQMRYCGIIAGVPAEEHEKDREWVPLEKHPDILHIVENGRNTVLIENPLNDPRTDYFREIIWYKQISQILYLPLLDICGSGVAGVIVIDAIDGKKFTVEEIHFAEKVAKMIGFLIGQEGVFFQNYRHEVANRTLPIGGFAERIAKSALKIVKVLDDADLTDFEKQEVIRLWAMKIQEYAETVSQEMQKLGVAIPKTNRQNVA